MAPEPNTALDNKLNELRQEKKAAVAIPKDGLALDKTLKDAAIIRRRVPVMAGGEKTDALHLGNDRYLSVTSFRDKTLDRSCASLFQGGRSTIPHSHQERYRFDHGTMDKITPVCRHSNIRQVARAGNSEETPSSKSLPESTARRRRVCITIVFSGQNVRAHQSIREYRHQTNPHKERHRPHTRTVDRIE